MFNVVKVWKKCCLECVNTLRQRQNVRHFAEHIYKCIFLNENVYTSIEISLKFVLKCSINNIPALGQIMAWRRPGDKPLSEPMTVGLLTHLCVAQSLWVKWCSCNALVSTVLYVTFMAVLRVMMTSSNGNIFHVTGPLCGKFTGHQVIPLTTKASDVKLWLFLWSTPEQTVGKQSRCHWFETPARSLWRHCNGTPFYLLPSCMFVYREHYPPGDV